MPLPFIEVRDLSVRFQSQGAEVTAVKNVDLSIAAGEVLAVVGESGSGKSTLGMSLLGLLPDNATVTGSATIDGWEIVGASQKDLRKIRGVKISAIFQDPMSALNPVYTVGYQIAEVLKEHQQLSATAIRKRVIELLTLVEIPQPEVRVSSFPHQLSGGQRQRVMIAQALACNPKLLVADEPTTALDVTVQAGILDLLRDLSRKTDAGILLITHDMGVVADMADRIMVMKDGSVVETGDPHPIFVTPRHPYTQQLLKAVPQLGSVIANDPLTVAGGDQPRHDNTVELTKLTVDYPRRGRHPAFRALDDVTLTIRSGEFLGLVGESGSGKTTLGRALIGFLPPRSGSLQILGEDMSHASSQQWKRLRRKLSFVFQDPGSSLNPRMSIEDCIAEPMRMHKIAASKEIARRTSALLDDVELPQTFLHRRPHELSGGQRQRVGIARSLALKPQLLIADEPTSALDVSVQAQILALIGKLQETQGFSCLFISHDLAVVERLCRRIAVMQNGRLVEIGDRRDILTAPKDEYTQRLVSAVLIPDPELQRHNREARLQLTAG